MATLSQSDKNLLVLIVRVVASLSLVGVSCIFADVIRNWHRVRKAPSRIIVWWTLASSIPLPAMLLGRSVIPTAAGHSSFMCSAQGSVITYGMLSMSLWAAAMATNIYLAVSRKFSMSLIFKIERIYHVVAWGLPLVVALVPMMLAKKEPFYSDALFWCWVSDSWASWRMISFYGPLWIIFCYCTIVYATVGLEIRRAFRHSNPDMHSDSVQSKRAHKASVKYTAKTSLYLGAFALTFFAATLHRVVSMVKGTQFQIDLAVFHALTIPSAGILNALVYYSAQIVSCVSPRPRRSGMDQGDNTSRAGGNSTSRPQYRGQWESEESYSSSTGQPIGIHPLSHNATNGSLKPHAAGHGERAIPLSPPPPARSFAPPPRSPGAAAKHQPPSPSLSSLGSSQRPTLGIRGGDARSLY